MSLELIIRGGKFDGQTVRVSDHVTRFVVGRDPDCDLRITRQDVSREHCLFVIEQDWVVLHDLNSSNGTLVNGQPVIGPTPLGLGDQVQVGPLSLEARGEIFDRSGSDTLDITLDTQEGQTCDWVRARDVRSQEEILRVCEQDGSSIGIGRECPLAWTEAMSTAQTNISRASHSGVIGNKP